MSLYFKINFRLNFKLFLLVFLTHFALVSLASENDEAFFKGKNPRKKLGSKQKPVSFFNIDVFAGPALNNASGDYLKYQEEYYKTGQDYLISGGEFKNYLGVTGGLAVRIVPFWKKTDALSELSAYAGLQYYRRGFVHEFATEDVRNRPASDFTRWKESYSTNHVSIPVMFRYGSKFHVELGLAPEIFLSGNMQQTIERKSFGSGAFAGGFDEKNVLDYKITSKTMKFMTMGFNAGLGYNFIQEFGVKFFVNYNTGYFKQEPDLKHLQGSFLLVYTWHQ
jgi:hypothetical protein